MTGEQLIGRARERWEEIDNEGLDWKSFANGWLEGRIDRMKQLDKEVWDALNEQWGLTNKLDKKVWKDD